jgi:hypothetical protein
LKCITSKPAAPGLNRPRIAFMFAPSMYASAPAAWTASSSSTIRRSNSPRVEGLVSITAAVRGPSAARSASRSTPPSGADLTVTVRKPAIEAVAGLVPCDESGTITSCRSKSPRAWCQARIIRIPVSSPCAPAAGWSEAAVMPLISASIAWSSHSSSSVPWASASGASGWRRANPGSRAACSLILGLYFMVHDPSG